jgi:hypothetical protein
MIKIREPFYGAGTVMGWDKDRWGIVGLGVSKKEIDKFSRIGIKVGSSEPWIIKVDHLREWAESHKSIDEKKGTKLYVIPLKWLDENHQYNEVG